MKRFFTIATIALSFISCGENDSLIPEPTPPVERIPINISTSITRATDSAFEAGDKVGIFVVNEPNTLAASGNYVDNMGFTYSGQWAPDEEIFWKDQTTKADFYRPIDSCKLQSIGVLVGKTWRCSSYRGGCKNYNQPHFQQCCCYSQTWQWLYSGVTGLSQ